jgi:predicted nucleotide-binding protein (sugar kinase/HSP70/actin superfamily)
VVQTAGLHFEIMPEPDNQSLQYGREFGNRGQCNPTYFTVGNLIKHLIYLRDQQGLAVQEIVQKYAFVTAGGCGPCRMGMYATEYRKALRDAGFQGFRVLIFSRSGDVEDVLMDGLALQTKTLIQFFHAIQIGDILNTLTLQIRPFETIPGITDQKMQEVQNLLGEAIEKKRGLLKALWRARKIIQSIPVDRSQRKPIIHIMGEFWAKTTDGEGNYNLFRFIEKEGGAVSNETVTDWLLHQVWRASWMHERKRRSFFDRGTTMKLFILDRLIRLFFSLFCYLLGAKIHLSNHGRLEKKSRPYFDTHVDGGEDHMEVAHHIHLAENQLADLIISVKPFTCLSSSGVSDGVQVKVSEDYPDLEFLAVETNGDSAANFYSRIQMSLQKVIRKINA